MESTHLIAIAVLVAFGFGFGALTARASQARQKIHGGSTAKLFHYLACAVMTALTPTALTSIFVFHVGLLGAIIVIVSMFLLALALLIPYSIVETPAQAAYEKSKQERGWTAEDALRSGL